MPPKELLSYLSKEGFSTIYIDGGKVIQSFLKEDLIDELMITTVPVLIGSGIPLFDHLNTDLLFKHIRTAVYSNGLVKSHYERGNENETQTTANSWGVQKHACLKEDEAISGIYFV